MKNAYEIGNLSRQLRAVSEKIESLAEGIAANANLSPSLVELYRGLLLDEIEHTQILTLELTRRMAEAESPEDGAMNADEGEGSAFGPGDLTDTLGEKEPDTPAETEVEK